MASEDFRKNLKYLCGYFKSVAELCRRIEINRQQFNKYLGGQAELSNFNLSRRHAAHPPTPMPTGPTPTSRRRIPAPAAVAG